MRAPLASTVAFALLAGCRGASTPVAPAPAAPSASAMAPGAGSAVAAPARAPTLARYPFPGATAPVTLDYLACDRDRGRVWVPVGDTGSLDAFDVATRTFARVDGFPAVPREWHGARRMAGPSSVSLDAGRAWVGNRATTEVCEVDTAQLRRGACVTLPVAPDGVAFVRATNEVWVTTPASRAITVLDVSHPGTIAIKTTIPCGGEVEGYGVDEARGLFFTNLEDVGSTLAIDVHTRHITSTWSPGCGSDGPRGLAVDTEKQLVVVACTDHLQALDAAHGGALRGRVDTGAGVDNIDFAPGPRLVAAVAGKAARLTFARLGGEGALSIVSTVPTTEGTRNVVLDREGDAYVADGRGAQLWVVPHPAP